MYTQAISILFVKGGMMLTGRRIVLGITGSISAYKAPLIAREMVKRGADVRCVLTESGLRFVTKETLETITGNPVLSNMWDTPTGHEIAHISWARWADTILIAPATLNIVGKMASGIADDLLSTMVTAANVPVMIAPAMNTQMYNNVIFRENLGRLMASGINIISPACGELACGETGDGRLADIPDILDAVLYVKYSKRSLSGKTAIVTAGPTREMIDPVRFLSNPSTGKMGFEMARALRARGANVILVSGHSTLRPPFDVELVKVESASDMEGKVKGLINEADILVMTAAVADWRPEKKCGHKLKKNEFDGGLKLVRTDDILKELTEIDHHALIVGFALETDDAENNALKKLEEKSLDMVLVNMESPDSGFAVSENSGVLIDRFGKKTQIPRMDKYHMSELIVEKIAQQLGLD